MFPIRILALILAFAAQIASAQKPALQEIADRWIGEYDNHLQVRANLDRPGPAVPELTRERRELEVVRLAAPQLGDLVLFFEEYRESQAGLANRQRVVSLVLDAKRNQVRARQFFFKGARYDRPPLTPEAVARMSQADFDLSRPYCDLWFSWLLFTRKSTPHIAQQQGVWRGVFRRYDADGRLTAEFPGEITMRVMPKDGRLMYHQTNRYLPAGKPEEVLESYGEVRDGRVYFGNARLDAWKMDVPDDPSGRSTVILMQYKAGSGLYVHEIVSVSADGRHRARATQYLKDGRIVRRTLIDEDKVTDDWAAYDAARPTR